MAHRSLRAALVAVLVLLLRLGQETGIHRPQWETHLDLLPLPAAGPVSAIRLDDSIGVSSLDGRSTTPATPTPTPSVLLGPPAVRVSEEPLPASASFVSGEATAHQALPARWNWCEQGVCTPVKDQNLDTVGEVRRPCGSCWAFATVGVLESSIRYHDGISKDLSEQYLVSCNQYGWGCAGGHPAFGYYATQKGQCGHDAGAVYEGSFPYTASDLPCNAHPEHHERIDCWDYVDIDPSAVLESTLAIKEAIYKHGTVYATVCVGSAFQSYRGGIFAVHEGDIPNHAVVLVGWDDSEGIWYLRNSWGPEWGEAAIPGGEKGYMRIRYGTSNVGSSASYVVYRDSQPPTTTAALDGTVGENGWYRSNVRAALTATDDGCGIQSTRFRVDSGIWQTYDRSRPPLISGDVAHALQYKTMDRFGNQETTKSISFKIDAVPPSCAFDLDDGAPIAHAALVQVSPSASDAASGVSQIRLRDGGGAWSPWQPCCAGSLYWPLPADYRHSYDVGAQFRDEAGNESRVCTDTIALDMYPGRPWSVNYRLLASTVGATGPAIASSQHLLTGTVGQPAMIGNLASTNYVLQSGYWAMRIERSTVMAETDRYAVDRNSVLTVTAAKGVLTNDTGSSLIAVLASDVGHGTLTLNANGSFTYAPIAGFAGGDTFTYLACDPGGVCDPATALVSVHASAAANKSPSAEGNSYSADEDTPLIAPAPGVLGNDRDDDGDPLVAALIGSPDHGMLSLGVDGAFTYTPTLNYAGSDAFTYVADDGIVASEVATVTLIVRPVNDRPTISTPPDQTTLVDISIGPLPVTVGDVETPVDELVLSCTSSNVALMPASSITLGGSGVVRTATLTPAASLTGATTITLTVSDGTETASDTFRLTVSRGAPQSYLYLPLLLRNH